MVGAGRKRNRGESGGGWVQMIYAGRLALPSGDRASLLERGCSNAKRGSIAATWSGPHTPCAARASQGIRTPHTECADYAASRCATPIWTAVAQRGTSAATAFHRAGRFTHTTGRTKAAASQPHSKFALRHTLAGLCGLQSREACVLSLRAVE